MRKNRKKGEKERGGRGLKEKEEDLRQHRGWNRITNF